MEFRKEFLEGIQHFAWLNPIKLITLASLSMCCDPLCLAKMSLVSQYLSFIPVWNLAQKPLAQICNLKEHVGRRLLLSCSIWCEVSFEIPKAVYWSAAMEFLTDEWMHSLTLVWVHQGHAVCLHFPMPIHLVLLFPESKSLTAINLVPSMLNVW